jgi:hypothetical protein
MIGELGRSVFLKKNEYPEWGVMKISHACYHLLGDHCYQGFRRTPSHFARKRLRLWIFTATFTQSDISPTIHSMFVTMKFEANLDVVMLESSEEIITSLELSSIDFKGR